MHPLGFTCAWVRGAREELSPEPSLSRRLRGLVSFSRTYRDTCPDVTSGTPTTSERFSAICAPLRGLVDFMNIPKSFGAEVSA